MRGVAASETSHYKRIRKNNLRRLNMLHPIPQNWAERRLCSLRCVVFSKFRQSGQTSTANFSRRPGR